MTTRPRTHSLLRVLPQAALASVALLLASCVVPTSPSANYSVHFDPPVIQPQNPSNVKVKMSLNAQRVYVVEGDTVLLATPCSVGRPSTPTPTGNFTIYHKKFDRRRISQPGAGYPMTYWMEFKTAYGMHWGFVKPFPCTHGCVRLPIKSAQKIFSLVRPGTPLNISYTQPWDETVGKRLPVLDDSKMPDPPWSYMTSRKVFEDAAKGKFYTY